MIENSSGVTMALEYVTGNRVPVYALGTGKRLRAQLFIKRP
jgi:hypothetical protein